MFFLNPWMLLGLIGLSVPLLLHLFNRRKSSRREWGAMMFLAASLAQRRKKVMIEEILLLVTRCLIMTFAALAFARPFVSSGSAILWVLIAASGILAVVGLAVSAAVWSQPGLRKRIWIGAGALAFFAVASVLTEFVVNYVKTSHSGARDIAIVLDGSSSMTITSEGVRNFDEAKKIADDFIQSCPRNTAFSLIVGGSVSQALTPMPTTDRRQLLRLLDEAVPLQGTLQAPDALALAVTTLAQGYNANKQILLIGDGQSVGWNIGDDEVWSCVSELLGRLPGKPKIVWRTLPIPTGLRNLTVSGISFSRDIIGTDREVRIDVTVANNGEESATANSVMLSAEGKNYTDASLGQIQPGEKRTVSFHHRFTKTGTHPVTATLDVEDELSADNTMSRIAAVRGAMKVLVVEGAKARRFSDRPGAFLALALAPDAAVIKGEPEPDPKKPNNQKTMPPRRPRFLVAPRLIGAAELADVANLSEYAAVVLADVPRLATNTAERLTAYVERGGGLMVIHSTRSNAAFYNGWTDADGAPVMPLVLQGEGPDKSAGIPLDPKTLAHPALSFLVEHGDLATAIFENCWKTEESGATGIRIGGRLFDGSPLFADRKAGKGRILQFAAALDPAAGNLISRQSFLPMVHELVYYLAKPIVPDLNIKPSRGVSLALSGGTMPDFTEDESARGLRGVYLYGQDSGRVLRVAIDKTMDRTGKYSPYDQQLTRDIPVVIEWTGSLTVPKTGKYNIYFRSNGKATVSLTDDKKKFTLIRSNYPVDLVEGQRHDITIKYETKNFSGSYFQLRWSAPGIVGDQIIPEEFLSPVRTTMKEWSETYNTQVTAPDSLTPLDAVLRHTQDSLSLHIPHRLTPGVYVAQIPAALAPQLSELATVTDGNARLSFCVSTDGAESRLSPVTPDDAAFAARYADFAMADNADDMIRAMNGAAVGRELWRYAAVPLLCLILLEILLTRWITQQRRTGEEGRVAFDEANKPSSKFTEILNAIKNGGK